ncbi:FtsB family cell division protein [Mucilaginibacter sp. FT3.2]|uniref:FtsB family cell division protein n=1 Tax=Mucilaginibacter sp. FT3.2 TaxID=2723090 RepID=UPI0017D1B692|nr:cell division protein FtsB [Mucilaginibacter sp. FT3.2]
MKFIEPISMKRLINLFKNKFFLVTLAFLVWMIFFDKNDLFSQYEYRTQVNKLKKERDFYKAQTDQVTKELNELTSNPQQLEKFAREKYLMKKDNEDVYLVVPEGKK